MKILGLDCSSKTASVALCKDDNLLGQLFLNVGLTHSETLLPLVSQLLTYTHTTPTQLDALAVTKGPGSFTGLRIGIATVLGLAWASNLPCCGVSSLEAAAWNIADSHHTICAVMDARREQVYCGLFQSTPKGLARLEKDRIMTSDDLLSELVEKEVILVGDGAKMCYNKWQDTGLSVTLPPAHLRYPTGYGACLGALASHQQGGDAFVGASLLRAEYLRLSQAERERLLKEDKPI